MAEMSLTNYYHNVPHVLQSMHRHTQTSTHTDGQPTRRTDRRTDRQTGISPCRQTNTQNRNTYVHVHVSRIGTRCFLKCTIHKFALQSINQKANNFILIKRHCFQFSSMGFFNQFVDQSRK